MIDVIYKTVKPSHLKKLQIIQNTKNLILQVIFIFSDWSLIKLIIISSTPFCYWGEKIFERMPPEEWVISSCLVRDYKNLGASFERGGAWVKMPLINVFCRNVNSINLNKIFERKFNKHFGERIIKP